MSAIDELMEFIPVSPTAFHAVENIRRKLCEAGFRELNECEPWKLVPGGKYCLTRNNASVIGFRVPVEGCDHFQIITSHADSPTFKLKPQAGREAQGYALLNVEKYGGAIMSTWFDRPLSIAGRLTIESFEGIETRLANIDRDLALIPNVPIHFNREVNDGVKLNAQTDMVPIYGAAGVDYLALAAATVGVPKKRVIGTDLFLVNRDKPRLWGANREFIASPRLDDLECAFASLKALIGAKPTNHVDMMCVFDNEEVGSRGRQGADSTLLVDTLRRISRGLGSELMEHQVARSFMLSTDNAHAVHPNHPEKYDAENRVVMNGGVVVKFNASQKYTSDGLTQAVFETICRRAGVPVQRFANRSDIQGGSTLGNIANAHASMMAVDIGLAQLAMHSACESAGTKDLQYMIDAMRAFHEVEIDVVGDGRIKLGT